MLFGLIYLHIKFFKQQDHPLIDITIPFFNSTLTYKEVLIKSALYVMNNDRFIHHSLCFCTCMGHHAPKICLGSGHMHAIVRYFFKNIISVIKYRTSSKMCDRAIFLQKRHIIYLPTRILYTIHKAGNNLG